MSGQHQNRSFDELEVGDVVFIRNSMPVDAIRYLSITRSTSERNMRSRIHPKTIVHKDANARVLTGVTITSKRMSEIDFGKQQYFERAVTVAPGQGSVLITAGFNRVTAGNQSVRYICQLTAIAKN